MTRAEVEAIRLEGYEAGYKSGWDDANAETEASDRRIAADLERTLSELGFTYAEARAELLRGMRGLFDSVVKTFLPALAAEAVLPRVQSEIEAILDQSAAGALHLVASPDTARKLDQLAERYMETDLTITSEAAYPDGRVTLCHGAEAREIDLGALIGALSDAILDFADPAPQQQELHHA
jgi:flagellar assembly protein FliH